MGVKSVSGLAFHSLETQELVRRVGIQLRVVYCWHKIPKVFLLYQNLPAQQDLQSCGVMRWRF